MGIVRPIYDMSQPQVALLETVLGEILTLFAISRCVDPKSYLRRNTSFNFFIETLLLLMGTLLAKVSRVPENQEK